MNPPQPPVGPPTWVVFILLILVSPILFIFWLMALPGLLEAKKKRKINDEWFKTIAPPGQNVSGVPNNQESASCPIRDSTKENK